MIQTDIFDFAYVPDWYGQLDVLAAMALPESWRFKKPAVATRNTDTPILERYINMIFRKQSIDYNTESDPDKASRFFHIENHYPQLKENSKVDDFGIALIYLTFSLFAIF